MVNCKIGRLSEKEGTIRPGGRETKPTVRKKTVQTMTSVEGGNRTTISASESSPFKGSETLSQDRKPAAQPSGVQHPEGVRSPGKKNPVLLFHEQVNAFTTIRKLHPR